MKKIKLYFSVALLLILFLPTSIFAKAMYKMALKDWYNYLYFYPQTHADILFWEFEKYYWNWNEVILTEDERNKFISVWWKLEKRSIQWINRGFLKRYIVDEIVPHINVEWTWASLEWSWNWKVEISNNAAVDKKLDIDLTVYLLEQALKEWITEVVLPVKKTDPDLQISSNLRDLWINWIISVSQSDFSNSPNSRIINIDNAITKFNWIIIKPWEVFSFNDNLWPVNARTWFVKSLVIQWANLVAWFWWWVCQVSTTLYRSIMNSWLPIKTRRNHSFSVSHYDPQWSDATIYLWGQDLRFQNTYDFPIILQWSTKWIFAYFTIYWDTTKIRDVKLFGPYYSNYTNVPNRIIASSRLAYWEKRIRERGQPWFIARWFRVVDENIEEIISSYIPRATVWEIWGLGI